MSADGDCLLKMRLLNKIVMEHTPLCGLNLNIVSMTLCRLYNDGEITNLGCLRICVNNVTADILTPESCFAINPTATQGERIFLLLILFCTLI